MYKSRLLKSNEEHKAPIKGGRFARKIIRAQNRTASTYVPGQLGASYVSQKIKDKYRTIMNRRQRKRMARALKRPIPLFYNGPVYKRRKSS